MGGCCNKSSSGVLLLLKDDVIAKREETSSVSRWYKIKTTATVTWDINTLSLTLSGTFGVCGVCGEPFTGLNLYLHTFTFTPTTFYWAPLIYCKGLRFFSEIPQRKIAIQTIILVRFRPGVMNWAPVLNPRTHFELYWSQF